LPGPASEAESKKNKQQTGHSAQVTAFLRALLTGMQRESVFLLREPAGIKEKKITFTRKWNKKR
jgi:hypothetical protein